MNKLIADIIVGPLKGVGTLSSVNSEADATTLFTSTLSKIIGVITVVGFIIFTFMIIMGAIRIVTSGGDKGALEGARKQITSGIIGVVVLIAAIFIVSLLGTLLGVNSILNPTCIISNTC